MCRIRENVPPGWQQRQQESEQRGIRAGLVEGNASGFHRATFYRGDA